MPVNPNIFNQYQGYGNPFASSPVFTGQGGMGGTAGLGATPSGAEKRQDYWRQAIPGIGAGLGALGGSFFGGDYDPYGAASPYLEGIPGMLEGYYGPYVGAGERAIPGLEEQYGRLLSDPGGVMGGIGAGFQESPGYQFSVEQARKASEQGAAAGGMVGSPQQQQEIAETVTGLANQDYYNYLSRALGMYGEGLSGTRGLAQMGYGAATGLGQNLANVAMSQANLAAGQEEMKRQQEQGMWGTMGGLAGGIAGMFI